MLANPWIRVKRINRPKPQEAKYPNGDSLGLQIRSRTLLFLDTRRLLRLLRLHKEGKIFAIAQLLQLRHGNKL